MFCNGLAVWLEGKQNSILLGVFDARSISAEDATRLLRATRVIVFNYSTQLVLLGWHALGMPGIKGGGSNTPPT